MLGGFTGVCCRIVDLRDGVDGLGGLLPTCGLEPGGVGPGAAGAPLMGFCTVGGVLAWGTHGDAGASGSWDAGTVRVGVCADGAVVLAGCVDGAAVGVSLVGAVLVGAGAAVLGVGPGGMVARVWPLGVKPAGAVVAGGVAGLPGALVGPTR